MINMQVTRCKEGNQQVVDEKKVEEEESNQVDPHEGGDNGYVTEDGVSGHEDPHPQGPGGDELAPEVKERKEVNDKESSDSLQLILPGDHTKTKTKTNGRPTAYR